MLRRAREVISSGDERSVVDYAIEANRTVVQANTELEEAKGFLRKVALGRRAGEALSVELEGNLGVATVNFSRSDPKTRKGKDLKDIEVNLAPEVFAKLFTKVVHVQPVGDFEVRLAQLPPADRAIIEQFVEIKLATPKVHLTK